MNKLDYTKKITFVVLLWSLVCGTLSYILAFKGLSSNMEVTHDILLFVTAPTITGYLATKTVEKTSRNKYKLDADGSPLQEKQPVDKEVQG